MQEREMFTMDEIIEGLKVLLKIYNNLSACLSIVSGQEHRTFQTVESFLEWMRRSHAVPADPPWIRKE